MTGLAFVAPLLLLVACVAKQTASLHDSLSQTKSAHEGRLSQRSQGVGNVLDMATPARLQWAPSSREKREKMIVESSRFAHALNTSIASERRADLDSNQHLRRFRLQNHNDSLDQFTVPAGQYLDIPIGSSTVYKYIGYDIYSASGTNFSIWLVPASEATKFANGYTFQYYVDYSSHQVTAAFEPTSRWSPSYGELHLLLKRSSGFGDLTVRRQIVAFTSASSAYCYETCSGNGLCKPGLYLDSCLCKRGYQGVYCGSPLCDDPMPCGDHGWCTGPNVCTCDAGWTGSQCTTAIPCTYTGYAGTAGACTCASGYYGTVSYSGGFPVGCTACQTCPSNTYANGGCSGSQNRICTAIPCTYTGYTGTAGACTCASGYYGTVSYSGGFPVGCTGISCLSPVGYNGTAGACTCASGYYGTASYSGNFPVGCQACQTCPSNTYANGGCSGSQNRICAGRDHDIDLGSTKSNNEPAIPCDYWILPFGYAGTAGACTCASGYYGTVYYSRGFPFGCRGISCLSPVGYNGTAGACTCASGYYGTASYSGNFPVGCQACDNQTCPSNTYAAGCSGSQNRICKAIPCDSWQLPPGYAGTAGACTCASGYHGTVSYSGGVPFGCTAEAFPSGGAAPMEFLFTNDVGCSLALPRAFRLRC
eukprot:g63663.t1